MKITQTILAILFLLVGCSKLQQDPLSDLNQVVRTGVEAPTLPNKPEPINSDAVRIDAVDFFSYKEKAPGEFVVSVRILLPDYSYEIEVENMSDAVGAVFDAKSGRFSWTPAQGTIGPKDNEIEIPLNFKVIATKKDSPSLTGSKSVLLRLTRNLQLPEIVSIQKQNSSLREGDIETISVKVKDQDALTDKETWPDLQISGPFNKKNLAPFVSVESPQDLGNHEYSFMISVDLRGVELTDSVEEYGFTVRAQSAFQKVSKIENISYTVFTSFSDIQTTWTDMLHAKQKDKMQFQFSVFDPKSELNVELYNFFDLPIGATAKCSKTKPYFLDCQFSWETTEKTTPNTYYIVGQFSSKNSKTEDSLLKSTKISFGINLAAFTKNEKGVAQ